jgi:hypothetical protein
MIKKSMSRYIILILISFNIISCAIFKSHRVAIVNSEINTDSVNQLLHANFFDYEYLSAKTKITVINTDGKTEFSASVRIKKDSAIWISISPALGIEIARVLITKDSIKIIDRFNKKYYSTNYNVFKDYTSIPITLNTLESIIAGLPIYYDEKKLKAKKQDTLLLLTSSQKKIQNTLYLNPDYTIWRMDLIDSAMGKSLNLKYKSYNRDNKKPFALERELDLNDEKKTNVFINFSKVKIDSPLKFPFNVKEKYD